MLISKFWFLRGPRLIKGSMTIQLAGKTCLIDFAGKESTLRLSTKTALLDLADKIRKLKLGNKETLT